jgi:hypothetical protein
MLKFLHLSFTSFFLGPNIIRIFFSVTLASAFFFPLRLRTKYHALFCSVVRQNSVVQVLPFFGVSKSCL